MRGSQQALVLAKLLDGLVGGVVHGRDILTVLTVIAHEIQLILYNGYNEVQDPGAAYVSCARELALRKGRFRSQIVAPVIKQGTANAQTRFATAGMGAGLD
jgi:hypothetical protein